MVRGMTLIETRVFYETGYQIMDITERYILMKAFVVKKDMIVLAVMQESSQEGLRAGRGGTR
jgi:hypothetical protein